MENQNRKKHWEDIYRNKEQKDVSWYQPVPQTSLDLIAEANLPKDAKIIDVGGGDSLLVDHLLEQGYTDLSVLDIAAPSLEKAVKRLGKNAEKVKWIIADVTTFEPSEQYDLWHDRAAFHFLTDEKQITDYVTTVNKAVKEKGTMIIGTFSEDGPTKCSGVEIKQYNQETMDNCFDQFFKLKNCITVDHETPNGNIQNFIFCSFWKMLGERKIGEVIDFDDKDQTRKLPLVFREGEEPEDKVEIPDDTER